MLTYRDLILIFRELGLRPHSRVIFHACLSSLGPIAGGADTLVGALISTCEVVMAPTFTHRTMVIPPVGPPDNGLEYGAGSDRSRMAEVFHSEMPADPAMGAAAEALRLHPEAGRSTHPLLSFAATNGEQALAAQTLEVPLAPIEWLAEFDGDVLLLGVDQRANASIHFAEQLAGRKQFIRWALTKQGVVECPGWPGCPDGFEALSPRLEGVIRKGTLGEGTVQMIPLRDLIHIVVGWIREDPRALLCDKLGCDRCATIRAHVRTQP
jgi:aminoglycoside 3-N-acetyltransferase